LGLFLGIRPFNWLIISVGKNASKQKWRDEMLTPAEQVGLSLGNCSTYICMYVHMYIQSCFSVLIRNIKRMTDRASTLRDLIAKAVMAVSEK
jgi:hypothetical protein